MRKAHPERESLHNEVHARPYEQLVAPLALSHIGWLSGADGGRAHLCELLRNLHLPLPADGASHLSVDLGGVHLRWERHTEFHTCTFWRPLREMPEAFESPPFDRVPTAWLEAMPGEWLVGLHMLVLRDDTLPEAQRLQRLVHRELREDSLVGSRLMDGGTTVHADFRLGGDGFERLVLAHDQLNPRRLGRAVQRLLEVETYRMMALLGLPMAREVGAALANAERDLAGIAGEIRSAGREHEPELLRRLTELAGEVESLYARTHARFSASGAYFELVRWRIDELREQRVGTLQTLGEFMERRLAPAMQTCAWAGRRQQALSERISRTSNLLRTRVEVEQQQASRELLASMNRRQQAQVLLQSAVEGLSIAAVTYYGAGLVGYLAKGARAAGASIMPELAVAVSIPLIALAVWLGLRRLHRKVQLSAD